MPKDSTRASPNRFDAGPEMKIWQVADTTPVTAKARPTSHGVQLNRAWVHNPNTDSMPLKAQPASKVTSISRPITGLVNASVTTAQRLGRWPILRWVRLSFRKKIRPVTQIADKLDATSSGMRKPAWL